MSRCPRIAGLGVAMVALLASACGGDSPTAPGSSTPVASLALTLDRDTLLVRETFEVPVTLLDDHDAILTGRPVTWASSDPSVLTVSPGGVLTALHAGTATLSASSGSAEVSRELTIRALHFADVYVGPGEVSCGREATGELWCWGLIPANGFGNGSSKNVPTPVPRRSAIAHRFSTLSLGRDFACGIEDGAVLCWRSNAYGELGDGLSWLEYVPQPVAGLSAATAVAVGGDFGCALAASGQVQCWGGNGQGQLGDGTRISRPTPAAVIGISGAVSLSAGDYHACAIVGSAASCWGSDFGGELGHDTTYNRLSPVRAAVGGGSPPAWSVVTAKDYHSCALTPAGEAWCWGLFDTGVSDGWDTRAESPVAQAQGHQFVRLAEGDRQQCGLEAGGDVWCWVFGHAAVRFPSAVPITDIAGMYDYTCALDATGTVRCWAVANPNTAPAVVSAAPPFVRLAADGNSACGLTSGGAVWCWGEYSAPVASLASGSDTFSSIWNGAGRVCALTAGGDAWCRTGSAGQFVVNAAGYSLVAVGNGYSDSCGLTAAGAALCWGLENASGHLGDGTQTPHAAPAPVAGGITFSSIAVGSSHSCGGTAAGAVYCWGSAYDGQMGDGTLVLSRVPVPVSGNHAFTALASSGGTVTCGLRTDGAAVCWPSRGELVAGPPLAQLAVGDVQSCGLDAAGGTSCWSANRSGTWSVTPLASAPPFASIAGGGTTTCARTAAGAAWCWGSNANGNLGSPDARGLSSSAVPVRVYGSE